MLVIHLPEGENLHFLNRLSENRSIWVIPGSKHLTVSKFDPFPIFSDANLPFFLQIIKYRLL